MPLVVPVDPSEFGLSAGAIARDVWAGTDLPPGAGPLTFTVAAHGAVLLRFRATE